MGPETPLLLGILRNNFVDLHLIIVHIQSFPSHMRHKRRILPPYETRETKSKENQVPSRKSQTLPTTTPDISPRSSRIPRRPVGERTS